MFEGAAAALLHALVAIAIVFVLGVMMDLPTWIKRQKNKVNNNKQSSNTANNARLH